MNSTTNSGESLLHDLGICGTERSIKGEKRFLDKLLDDAGLSEFLLFPFPNEFREHPNAFQVVADLDKVLYQGWS